MSDKRGIVVMILGAVLLLSALLLLLHNREEDHLAGQKAESLLAEVESVIQAAEPEPAEDDGEREELPVVSINNYEYVGYIEILALGVKLPVMSEWDYARLKIAPCRQFGSSRTDDLVIAAHNYSSHFGKLKNLVPGDAVRFTDMDGVVNDYVVVKTATVDPYDVEAVANSGHALVLYTCTLGGKTRVAVFCDRTETAEIP